MYGESRYMETQLPPQKRSIPRSNGRAFLMWTMRMRSMYYLWKKNSRSTMETDVLLSCDVFEAFRSVCMDEYELDPFHFTHPRDWRGQRA